MNKKYKYIVIAAPKSKIQAGFAEEKDGTGNYPFFTSGESIYYVDDSFLKISKVTGINVFMATGGTANIQKYSGVASYSTDTYVLKANKN
ncbi:hypothetical protein FACS189459_2430 [Bacilli bacterium]|nr:hypothetical protein FACS189459_2430 [Bacilli bacterium]